MAPVHCRFRAGTGDGASPWGRHLRGPCPGRRRGNRILRASTAVIQTIVYTDETGGWDAGEVPAGSYIVTFSVNIAEGSRRTAQELAHEIVEVADGEERDLTESLSGPHPEGEVYVVVHPIGMTCAACDLHAYVVKLRDGPWKVWTAY
jgi:hypothetical protein